MYASSYVPSAAGSVIVPASSYAGSHYGYGRRYSGSYYAPPQPYYPPPMAAPTYAPSPIVVPTASYRPYSYAAPPVPYYGGSSPTIIISKGRRSHSRHRSRHGRWYDYF